MLQRNLKAISRPLLVLGVLVFIIQLFLLKPHLRYGFADVDWSFLLSFKEYSLMFQNPIDHLLYAFSKWGVYTYQVYYIGLIEHFFGMDYKNFHQITHFLKFIGTLFVFPLIFLITKSKLAAFITTIVYASAYPAVGAMYTVVTSGLYLAIPMMLLFLIWYFRLVNKEKNSFLEIIIAIILFFVALLLATERMYPLLPTLILVELFWWYKNNFSKKILFKILKRLIFFAIIFAFLSLLNRSDYAGFFGGNTKDIYTRFIWGNWQVLMTPLISLGSLFLPRDYWKILGTPTIENFLSFVNFYLFGPFVIFSLITAFLSSFLTNKKIKFLLISLSFTSVFAVIIYFLSSHQIGVSSERRMHFDINTVLPALLGAFIISFNAALFKQWLDQGRKDNLLISMIGGVVIAFIFIILTWMAADYVLIFSGVHRYLVVPVIGSSLFLGGIITIIFNKLQALKFTKPFSFLIFFFLVLLTLFNGRVTSDYFSYELNYAGTDAAEHTRMKNKLWSYLGHFSKTEPSIFYFDESADHDNGYFDETTVMAGFNFWMRFRGREIVPSSLTPGLLRSNLICPQPRSMCLETVKSLVATQEGKKGLKYGGRFFKAENFYAFRFVSKDIVDIKEEIVKLIGLE